MQDRPDKFDEFAYDLVDDDTGAQPEAERNEEGTPKTMPYDRYAEIVEERNSLRDDVRELTKALAGAAVPQVGQQRQAPGNPADGGEDGEDPLEGLDPQVAQALRHLTESQTQHVVDSILQQFGPALEAASRSSNIEEIDRRVPGFKDGLMAEVEEEYRKLPPEEQERYSGRVGIEALANRVRIRKLEEAAQSGQQQVRSPGMGIAARIPSSAPSHEAAPRGGPEEFDPWALSDEEFERRFGD